MNFYNWWLWNRRNSFPSKHIEIDDERDAPSMLPYDTSSRKSMQMKVLILSRVSPSIRPWCTKYLPPQQPQCAPYCRDGKNQTRQQKKAQAKVFFFFFYLLSFFLDISMWWYHSEIKDRCAKVCAAVSFFLFFFSFFFFSSFPPPLFPFHFSFASTVTIRR